MQVERRRTGCTPSATSPAKGPFTHVSVWQARVLAAHLLGATEPFGGYDALAWATFTDPEVGRVGHDRAGGARRGAAACGSACSSSANTRGWIHGPGNDGFVKVVEDADRGVLVGATVVGPHGGELIGMLTVAVHAAGAGRAAADHALRLPDPAPRRAGGAAGPVLTPPGRCSRPARRGRQTVEDASSPAVTASWCASGSSVSSRSRMRRRISRAVRHCSSGRTLATSRITVSLAGDRLDALHLGRAEEHRLPVLLLGHRPGHLEHRRGRGPDVGPRVDGHVEHDGGEALALVADAHHLAVAHVPDGAVDVAQPSAAQPDGLDRARWPSRSR